MEAGGIEHLDFSGLFIPKTHSLDFVVDFGNIYVIISVIEITTFKTGRMIP